MLKLVTIRNILQLLDKQKLLSFKTSLSTFQAMMGATFSFSRTKGFGRNNKKFKGCYIIF